MKPEILENLKDCLYAAAIVIPCLSVFYLMFLLDKTPERKPQKCQEVVRAFSPGGGTEKVLPPGWTAFGGDSGVVLAKRYLCGDLGSVPEREGK